MGRSRLFGNWQNGEQELARERGRAQGRGATCARETGWVGHKPTGHAGRSENQDGRK